MDETATPGIGPRLRAARHLAGYKDVNALAEALRERDVKRLGATKIRRMEREQEPSEFRDLAEIAAVCGLPVAWFSADFTRLEEISDEPRRVIAMETAAALARADARRAGKQPRTQLPPGGDQ